LARGIAVFTHIPILSDAQWSRLVETEGLRHLNDAYKKGKGMITFTAHYGCWESMAVFITRYYQRVAMLVRPLDNPRRDKLVTNVRASVGGGVISSKQSFKEWLRLLRRNGILGIVGDQNFYKGGVFVDFFGRPAATNTLTSILARRTDCAVLPM